MGAKLGGSGGGNKFDLGKWDAAYFARLKDFVADRYCMFAERMEKAGAIMVGKTNSPVFGFRGTCDNYLFGPSRNPFDLT